MSDPKETEILPCPHCNGRGKYEDQDGVWDCGTCDGTGEVLPEENKDKGGDTPPPTVLSGLTFEDFMKFVMVRDENGVRKYELPPMGPEMYARFLEVLEAEAARIGWEPRNHKHRSTMPPSRQMGILIGEMCEPQPFNHERLHFMQPDTVPLVFPNLSKSGLIQESNEMIPFPIKAREVKPTGKVVVKPESKFAFLDGLFKKNQKR